MTRGAPPAARLAEGRRAPPPATHGSYVARPTSTIPIEARPDAHGGRRGLGRGRPRARRRPASSRPPPTIGRFTITEAQQAGGRARPEERGAVLADERSSAPRGNAARPPARTPRRSRRRRAAQSTWRPPRRTAARAAFPSRSSSERRWPSSSTAGGARLSAVAGAWPRAPNTPSVSRPKTRTLQLAGGERSGSLTARRATPCWNTRTRARGAVQKPRLGTSACWSADGFKAARPTSCRARWSGPRVQCGRGVEPQNDGRWPRSGRASLQLTAAVERRIRQVHETSCPRRRDSASGALPRGGLMSLSEVLEGSQTRQLSAPAV